MDHPVKAPRKTFRPSAQGPIQIYGPKNVASKNFFSPPTFFWRQKFKLKFRSPVEAGLAAFEKFGFGEKSAFEATRVGPVGSYITYGGAKATSPLDLCKPGTRLSSYRAKGLGTI